MPEICENWFGFVNSCIYCARQTHEIYLILPGSVDFKAESFETHWASQNLVNVVLFRIKDMNTSEITIKLKTNFYVGPVKIFPNFWHCIMSYEIHVVGF